MHGVHELGEAARLKLRLLADGVRVSASARELWAAWFEGPLTLAEYATTSGTTLLLPEAHYVNAPIGDGPGLPLLDVSDGSFVVEYDDEQVPVTPIPVPDFTDDLQPDADTGVLRPHAHFGVVHTDRVRVSPITGCAFRCGFCDLPYEFEYQKRNVENLLAVIRAADDDPAVDVRHVLVSGGTPRAPRAARPGRPGSDDEAWIDGIFERLAAESPLPVDVMLPPRKRLSHAAWMKDRGIHALSVNLEVSDEQRARQLAPAKAKIGRAHTLRYIEHAVEAFGVGQVQSLVVFGAAIEPLESTLRGVADLVDRGCVPVLSPFRPHHLTPLARAPAATHAEIVEAYERTLELCVESPYDIFPGPRCVACHHNTVSVPFDDPFFVGHPEIVAGARWTTS